MRILVALLVVAAICYADDDSSEEDISPVVRHVQVTPAVAQTRSLSPVVTSAVAQTRSSLSPVVTSAVAQTRSALSPVVTSAIAHVRSSNPSVPSAITHARSSSPAVMKIPKPGIRFNIPVPQTQGHHAIPVEKMVPYYAPSSLPAATVPVPKTTLKSATAAIPTPVDTLNSYAPVPAPVPAAPKPEFRQVATMEPSGIPLPMNSFLQGTRFENKLHRIPVPYYASSINYGPQIPQFQSAFEVPASVQPTLAVPKAAAVAMPTVSAIPTGLPLPGRAVPVPDAVPIHYTNAPQISIPTVRMPFLGGQFQRNVMETAHPFTYWGDINTPQQMTNFMDLNTGGFSYMNIIGDISTSSGYTLPVPQETTMEGHPFKAIHHSQIPQVAPAKDTAATTTTTTNTQSSPVIAA